MYNNEDSWESEPAFYDDDGDVVPIAPEGNNSLPVSVWDIDNSHGANGEAYLLGRFRLEDEAYLFAEAFMIKHEFNPFMLLVITEDKKVLKVLDPLRYEGYYAIPIENGFETRTTYMPDFKE